MVLDPKIEALIYGPSFKEFALNPVAAAKRGEIKAALREFLKFYRDETPEILQGLYEVKEQIVGDGIRGPDPLQEWYGRFGLPRHTLMLDEVTLTVTAWICSEVLRDLDKSEGFEPPDSPSLFGPVFGESRGAVIASNVILGFLPLRHRDARGRWGFENFPPPPFLLGKEREYLPHLPLPPYDPTGWDPASESVDQAKKRLLEGFKEELEAYVEVCRKLESARADFRILRKHGLRDIKRDLRWLAIYQAHPEFSYEGLARHLHRGEKEKQIQRIKKKMAKQIPKAANRIGLPEDALKRGPEGRPRESS